MVLTILTFGIMNCSDDQSAGAAGAPGIPEGKLTLEPTGVPESDLKKQSRSVELFQRLADLVEPEIHILIPDQGDDADRWRRQNDYYRLGREQQTRLDELKRECQVKTEYTIFPVGKSQESENGGWPDVQPGQEFRESQDVFTTGDTCPGRMHRKSASRVVLVEYSKKSRSAQVEMYGSLNRFVVFNNEADAIRMGHREKQLSFSLAGRVIVRDRAVAMYTIARGSMELDWFNDKSKSFERVKGNFTVENLQRDGGSRSESEFQARVIVTIQDSYGEVHKLATLSDGVVRQTLLNDAELTDGSLKPQTEHLMTYLLAKLN